jgi:ribbon-helix-helix CopG family protein
MMSSISPSNLGITEEKIYLFQWGRRSLFIRLTLLDAERLDARARKRGVSATEFIRRFISQYLDGDDWRGNDSQ